MQVMKHDEIIKKLANSGVVLLFCTANGRISYISDNISKYFPHLPTWYVGKSVFRFLPYNRVGEVLKTCQDLSKTHLNSIRLTLPLG